MNNNNIFDLSESQAVARLVYLLIFSDEEIDRLESDFFDQMLQNLNLTAVDFESCLSEPVEHSFETVKAMSAEKRQMCLNIFRQAVHSDHVVALSELSRLNEILEKTHLFRPEKGKRKNTEDGFVSY